MKFLGAFILVLTISSVNAQSPYFNDTIDFSGRSETALGVVSCMNRYVVSGTSIELPRDYGIVHAIIDSTGKVLKKKLHPFLRVSLIRGGVRKSIEGNLIDFRNVVFQSNGTVYRRPYVLESSPDLDSLWSIEIQDSVYNELTIWDLLPDTDSTFILLCTRRPANDRTVIYRISKKEGVILRKEYSDIHGTGLFRMNMLGYREKYIVCTGIRTLSPAIQHLEVVYLDNSLNVSSFETFFKTNTTTEIEFTPPRTILLAGTLDKGMDPNSSNRLNQQVLMSIDTSGSVSFQKSIDSASTHASSYKVFLAKDSTIGVLGQHPGREQNTVCSKLVFFDKLGSPLDSHSYVYDTTYNQNYLYDIVQMPTSNYMAVGSVFPYTGTSQNLWILGLDSAACVPGCVNPFKSEIKDTTDFISKSLAEFNRNGFGIFPNPTSGVIRIKLNDQNEPNQLFYTIYNELGKLIQSGELEHKEELDLTQLERGTYTIVIDQGSKRFTSRLFKL